MYISPSSYEIFKTSDKLQRISLLLPVYVERRTRICSRWITRASTCPHDETAWLVSVSSPFQRLGERGTAWNALQGAGHDQKHSLHNIQEVIIQENYKVEFNKIERTIHDKVFLTVLDTRYGSQVDLSGLLIVSDL